ncbi:hypothetical protein GGR53DRAFT_526010 [Hypoxylon sp. FL1150]|nr:hypothetical protein GGR53DRAFT_526010 [Hypoxylon sp. FL1150]
MSAIDDLTISLRPIRGDWSYPQSITKYEINELATYNTHENNRNTTTHRNIQSHEIQSLPTIKHPLGRGRLADQPNDSDLSMYDEELDRHDRDLEGKEEGHRVITYPGQLPHVGDRIARSVFTVKDLSGTNRPYIPYDDLCRILLHQNKKRDLLNADLVTDTNTLWALFEAIYQKALGNTYPDKDKGISLAVQIEQGTTFLKVLNGYVVDGETLTEATARLKQARQGHPTIMAGSDHVRVPLNVSRRVISYGFDSLNLIVEDDNRVLSTKQTQVEVLRDSLKFKDGLRRQANKAHSIFAAQQTREDDKRNHRALGHLWFSDNKIARILEYSRSKKQDKTFAFETKFMHVNGVAQVPVPGSEGMQQTLLEAWVGSQHVKATMKCLQRVLRQVTAIAATQQSEGTKKFAIRQLSKVDDSMEAELNADVDLISPTMADYLGIKEENERKYNFLRSMLGII